MVQGRGRTPDWFSQPQLDRFYKETRKLPEPTVCPDCGAIFTGGRWSWGEAEADAHQARCPACTRIHNHDPAGYVHLGGSFLQEHREEISELARHIEKREIAEHPFKRIMAIEDDDDGGLLITTTDTHLAWTLGESMAHAYHGELKHRFAANSNVIHVTWNR